MSEFKHGNPEDIDRTVIDRMRLPDCHRLARAFDLPHTPNCVKDKILPVLLSAFNEGMFNDPNEVRERLAALRVRAEEAPSGGKIAKWRGPHDKWCIMDGESVVAKGLTKDEAQARI